MACKKNKWWPHNWLCLKGLYWVFVVLFYLTIAYMIYAIYTISASPMLAGADKIMMLTNIILGDLIAMLGFLTVAAILKALHKIVKSVAPCCCEQAKEEVVVVSSQDK